MEKKNGINKGVVLIKRINGLTLLYSFATKSNGDDFVAQIQDQEEVFYQMGDHCFNLITPIVDENIIGYNDDKLIKSNTNIIRMTKNVRK